MTNTPNLSPTAFWDVDMQTLDYEANARFVIEKVMNYDFQFRCYTWQQSNPLPWDD